MKNNGQEAGVPTMKVTSIAAFAATAVFAATLVNADGPRLNVDPNIHPHLAAAQDLARKSYMEMQASYQGKDWDANGHAQKAMDMLIVVNQEIAAAAERK
jgi:hypothetical protein